MDWKFDIKTCNLICTSDFDMQMLKLKGICLTRFALWLKLVLGTRRIEDSMTRLLQGVGYTKIGEFRYSERSNLKYLLNEMGLDFLNNIGKWNWNRGWNEFWIGFENVEYLNSCSGIIHLFFTRKFKIKREVRIRQIFSQQFRRSKTDFCKRVFWSKNGTETEIEI